MNIAINPKKLTDAFKEKNGRNPFLGDLIEGESGKMMFYHDNNWYSTDETWGQLEKGMVSQINANQSLLSDWAHGA